MELFSLAGAIGAAVCFGLSAILQAQGARAQERSEGVDPRLLVRLGRSAPFLIGVALDVLGFALELTALRTLPLFLVQSAIASSLAVTAIAAAVVLHERLGRREWIAVAAVCAGLGLLGVSAGREGASRPPSGFMVSLGAFLLLLALLAAGARRLPDSVRTVTLGAGSGLAFGVVALAARVLPSLSPLRLLTEGATYVVAAAGLLGFLLYTTALQSGAVTSATGAMVVGETLLPAGVGIVLLGDSARPGFVGLAIVGFLLAVAGALSLSRFGEPAAPSAHSPSAPA